MSVGDLFVCQHKLKLEATSGRNTAARRVPHAMMQGEESILNKMTIVLNAKVIKWYELISCQWKGRLVLQHHDFLNVIHLGGLFLHNDVVMLDMLEWVTCLSLHFHESLFWILPKRCNYHEAEIDLEWDTVFGQASMRCSWAVLTCWAKCVMAHADMLGTALHSADITE